MPQFGKPNTIEAQFCYSVDAAIQSRNGAELQSILLLEPPFPDIYQQLIASLQKNYPRDNPQSDARLEDLIKNLIPATHESEDEEGRPVPAWSQMVSFLATWMTFIRDVNVENLLETYERLSDLQQKANSALQHATLGILILPTLTSYAKVFSRVAIGLDKHPELIQHLLTPTSDEGVHESLPEKAANILRNGFITCLNDRNTAPGGIKNNAPDGKKIGIYSLANICLRILFQAEKLENCQTIFNNIQNSSPPLHIYPASQRVTYLYYLGRYQFANTRFYAAQQCLQHAYDTCPTDKSCISQRRLILIYLLSSNLLLGRLPSSTLWTRPEAHGLRARFEPLATCIRTGNLESFRRITNLDLSWPHAAWMCKHAIFYQLGNYCELYVQRSLIRKVFLLEGKRGAAEGSMPTVDLHAILAAFLFYEKRSFQSEAMATLDRGPGRRPIGLVLSDPLAAASVYIDPDFAELGLKPAVPLPSLLEIENICGSLIQQGFMQGFVSDKMRKFAILGAKGKDERGAVRIGFPSVWSVVKSKNGEKVRGWKLEGDVGAGVGGVVRLAGARAAGE